VDVAERMIETAIDEAAEAGLENVSFAACDVEVTRFDQTFDYAFSRMGTMFFANPVAALRNVREALQPGGLLNMVVWRRKLDNEFMHRAELGAVQFNMALGPAAEVLRMWGERVDDIRPKIAADLRAAPISSSTVAPWSPRHRLGPLPRERRGSSARRDELVPHLLRQPRAVLPAAARPRDLAIETSLLHNSPEREARATDR
jgi:SAM-dependent methyltransferase